MIYELDLDIMNLVRQARRWPWGSRAIIDRAACCVNSASLLTLYRATTNSINSRGQA